MSRWSIAQAVEIRWWKRYLRNKPVEDYHQWKSNYWNKLLEPMNSLLNLKQPQTILDAGCGPAGTFMVLSKHKVTALDPLLDQYQSEIKHFDPGHYPWTDFQTRRLEDFEASHQFDGIVCLNAINHVESIDLAMDKLLAALKPGGWIVLGIDAHNYGPLKHLFRAIPGDVLHPHQFDRHEYRSMLESRNVDVQYDELVKHEFIFDYRVMAGLKA